MASPSQLTIEQQLALLQEEFKQTLPGKVEEIEQLWNSLLVDDANDSALIECHRMVHTLVGSGGTFGSAVVTKISQELEQIFKSLINENNLSSEITSNINNFILKLKDAADTWQPLKKLHVDTTNETNIDTRKTHLIYIAEDDELLAKNMTVQLEKNGFNTKYFATLTEFSKAYSSETPSAIIMDVMFKEGSTAGIDIISSLNKENTALPPIIFISTRNDMEVRLAAAAAAAARKQRYFCKPVDVNKLTQSLDSLIVQTESQPFRVLFVDDDEQLLEYYEAILIEAGMDVKTISNPMESLKVLEEFKPDVVVLDIHMSECSGPQVAQVIRQDDSWVITPIIFLSNERDIDVKLGAEDFGGESFIAKPITAKHLVSVVKAKAERSRWNYKVKNDLEDTLLEYDYQLITSNEHDIVSTADITGRIISCNDKFCENSGYSRDELIGQNHRLLKSSRHTDSFYKDMWKTISSGHVWHGTICNYTKSGEEYWVESTIVPFIDNKGKPYKYVSARTDVTTVIQSEARLERSQEFANIGTWDWNVESGTLYWSDRIWPLFGYDKEVTKTTYDNFISAIHPDDRKSVSDAVTSCVEEGTKYNIEHRVVWPDGSIHWLNESGDVVRDRNNKPLHMLGVVQDITDKKAAEYSLILAREESETANRAKSEFLSSMSHELRTPMNAIMGFGQLLNLEIDNPLNANQKENVHEILKASDHLLELINEVLDLAKIEAGRIELSIEDVLLGDVLLESLQLILPLAEKRSISVELYRDNNEININDLEKDKSVIRADYTRTKQIIINLLSNAVKYNSENGKITISCIMSESNIRINVTDTGEGLTLEQQSHLFTAFNRLGAESTDIEGTGIGLVLTQNIVELMGGRIGVESEPGVGSTFWFELPNGVPELSKIVKNSSSANVEIELDESHSVLYIEDNPANLRLVTQLLGRLPNLNMWTAHEPMLGLELATENKPDLILLDINLPGMDGFEVLKLLKAREGTRNTPIIAISANAMPRDIEKGLEAGFDDYITKPIDLNALLSSVDDKLNKN